jgi:ribosomal-protein-alanine N-acetyltransferase
MTREDVPLVAALEAEVEVTPWSERALEDALGPDYVARVLTDDEGQVLSWIVWRTILDESELLLIGTAKNAQRKGYARALLQDALSEAGDRGIVAMHLEVRAGNDPAAKLYETLGFAIVGLRKGYYFYDGRREDALLMTNRWKED